MANVVPGRFTAATDEPFVVFIIGMRVNRWWQPWKWLPTFLAMPPMLRTLYQHQSEKGFLGGELFFTGRTSLMTQYWRSFEDLERFARSKDDPHLGAWRRFNKAIGGDGSVGVYHETYRARPGDYESVYVNMPDFGLMRAFGRTPATGRRFSARERMERETTVSPAQ